MRRKIMIGICAAGIAALAAAGIFVHSSKLSFKNILEPAPAFTEKASAPDELLRQYFAFADNGQYEDMYEMLTDQARETISKDDFAAKNKSIYDGIEAKNIMVTIEQVSDDIIYVVGGEPEEVHKIVDYSLSMETLAGKISYLNQAVFTPNVNEEYGMEWTTHTIFPNLDPEDKVRVRTLPASRGCIYDRNGELLAGPGVASAIGFVPGKMRMDEAGNTTITESETAVSYNMEDIVKVAGLLEITPESIIEKLSASYVKDDTFVLLKTVSRDAASLKQELLTVKGILISDTPVRYYPLGEKASHLVGYIQGINAEELKVLGDQGYNMNSVIGKAGLEKVYEDQLRAADGCEIVIVDGSGTLKQSLVQKDKDDGKDITLTINAQLQAQLYDLFSTDKSCSAAMNPKTGEVLALVSTPACDANDFVLGMSASRWTELNEDADLPFFNRFKAALCPGSTMKAITAAIAIDTGMVSPDEDFGHSGLKWQKDRSWGGYYITTTMEYEGPANIQNGLKYSDNIFFAKAAIKIGADRFAEELIKLGFEEPIPFEYGLSSSSVSTTETFQSEIQLADSGFGQGEILTNPIHLAAVYSSFVNDGDILQPYLILGKSPEVWKPHAFSPETAGIIREYLIQVIESGSAADAKVSGRILGGKTGTAEIKQSKNDKGGTELGWFIEFTADENEDTPLIIVSMVEDVKGRGGSHYVSSRIKTIFE